METLFDDLPYITRIEEVTLHPHLVLTLSVRLSGGVDHSDATISLQTPGGPDWCFVHHSQGIANRHLPDVVACAVREGLERALRQLDHFA